MIGSNEIEVRTGKKGMLVFTAVNDNGQIYLITRNGKKEDRILLNDALTKLFGRSVAIMMI